MQVIKASQFKQQCLALLDRLDADGLLITKRGKPVARLVPADAGLIGCLKGKIEIRGDLFSTGLNWDAQS